MTKQRYRWAAIVAPAFIMAMFTIPLPAIGDVLTLDQAIQTATANNRLLKNAQLEVSKAQSQVDTTRIQGLPKISLLAEGSRMLAPVHFSFKKGVFGEFPVIGPVPSVRIIRKGMLQGHFREIDAHIAANALSDIISGLVYEAIETGKAFTDISEQALKIIIRGITRRG